MFFLFLLFNLISAKNRQFFLTGLDSNLNTIFVDNCEYLNCSNRICDLLNDTSLGLSSILLVPFPLTEKMACPYINNDRKTNMIVFVVNNLDIELSNPIICGTMNDCFASGCDNYDSSQSIAFGFFGRCY